MQRDRPRILVIGGTAEGRSLADLLAARDDVEVVSSLAGITSDPLRPRGGLRSGGFGGVDGLGRYLAAERIALVVDASHPFAETISRNATAAAHATGCRYVRLERPPWAPSTDDRWISVASLEDAARTIPDGACALLTTGGKELRPFLARTSCQFIARMIEPPHAPPPAHVTVVLARPPFTVEGELALIDAHAIDHIVTKNAGGDLTAAKLEAARRRALPVVMVARPLDVPPPDAVTVEAAMTLIAEHLARSRID